MQQPDPVFPPLLKGHAVKAPLTSITEACRLAARGELGAGDIVWSRNTAKAECALILEPDVSLARAQQMVPLVMVALAETLGALCPPELPVEFAWPDRVLVNGGDAGRVTMIAPAGTASAGASEPVPRWIVIGVTLHLAARDGEREPGLTADITALAEEGAGDVTRSAVLEHLAACMLAWLDTWSSDGFRSIHDQWLFRTTGRQGGCLAPGETEPVTVLGLDEDVGLLIKNADGTHRAIAFAPHLRRWP
jgi:BirA family transcriptional regulator, biotin operon repressor / biotin---[acetyl-CoA-carboxylase] ligase